MHAASVPKGVSSRYGRGPEAHRKKHGLLHARRTPFGDLFAQKRNMGRTRALGGECGRQVYDRAANMAFVVAGVLGDIEFYLGRMEFTAAAHTHDLVVRNVVPALRKARPSAATLCLSSFSSFLDSALRETAGFSRCNGRMPAGHPSNARTLRKSIKNSQKRLIFFSFLLFPIMNCIISKNRLSLP